MIDPLTLARRGIPRKGGWSEMTEYCFVTEATGRVLSPTNIRKAWYLVRTGRAKLVNKWPMAIRLYKEVPIRTDKSEFILGVDDGSKYVGLAIVQKGQNKTKVVFKATIIQRQDVSHLMTVRRGYRRYRRYHKKYRMKRFDNRASSRRKGRLAPSIKQRKHAILRVVNKIIAPIDRIVLEDVTIDIRALTDGYKPYRWQYQKSNRLDENLRRATLIRDEFACQMCGETHRLQAHHIIPRSKGGTDTIGNLITLCSTCHDGIKGSEIDYAVEFQKIITGCNPRLKIAAHTMQGKTYLRKNLEAIAPLDLIAGGDTANRRNDWGIPKSHSNDAVVMCGCKVNQDHCAVHEWTVKPQRKKNKGKVEQLSGFRHRDYVRYTKRSGESYTGYITALHPNRQCVSLTTDDGKILKRYGVNRMQLLWRFKNIYWLNAGKEGLVTETR